VTPLPSANGWCDPPSASIWVFHPLANAHAGRTTNSARVLPWPNGEEEKQKRYCCIDAFRLRMMSIAKTINMATMLMAKNQ